MMKRPGRVERSGHGTRWRGRRDDHAQARRLLTERMDGSLDAESVAELAAHLAGCARCRSVARDYHEGRMLLRGLRPSVPPRDLGARISAALDREVAGRGRHVWRVGRPGHEVVGTVVAASAAVAVLVVGARLLLAPAVGPRPDATLAAVPRATPFSVPRTELALVEIDADGLTVYQTAVSLVCPPSAVDCATAAYESRRVVAVAGDLVPRGVVVDRGSRLMALLAEDAFGADTVSVVDLPAMDQPADPRGAGPGPDGRWPVRGAPQGSPGGAASVVPAPSPSPADAPARMLAILEGVQVVGASPAWSADGSILAFSAMPADRTRGPDVYIWRPGQERAHRLTSDHASWFASWSASRVVLSRTDRLASRVTAETVLVDPADGTEQVTALSGAWLPSVDPSGQFAVAWRGTLAAAGALIRPRTGGLALIDWSTVDPDAAPSGPGVGTRLPDARPAGVALALRGPSSVGFGAGGQRAATAATVPDRDRMGALSRAAAGPAVGTARDRTRARPGSAAMPADGRVALGWLESVEDGVDAEPLAVDWQVRWATTGTTFGYWVTDARGASWGRLTVLRVLPATRRIDRSIVLLGPTVARRSFTLGDERVAWVAPAEEGADGELRVRTWGDSGEGDLRLREIRLRNGIPAF
jgi:hypothetical protein